MLKNAYRDAASEASRYLAPREWVSWLILSLRSLALTPAAIACNVVLVALARHVRWLRQTINVQVLDTLVTTLVVYLTGRYRSCVDTGGSYRACCPVVPLSRPLSHYFADGLVWLCASFDGALTGGERCLPLC